MEARLLARDRELDLAALSVPRSGLQAIHLGDSRSLKAGQWVMALGHPWGVAGAVTSGIVIGLEQSVDPDREWIAAALRLRPGHSGGALVDVTDALVGINTMMAGPQVGMAIPVHVVTEFLRRTLDGAEAVSEPVRT